MTNHVFSLQSTKKTGAPASEKKDAAPVAPAGDEKKDDAAVRKRTAAAK